MPLMPNMRAPTLVLLVMISAVLSACQEFPELEVSEAQFDAKSPYPKLVPLDELLKEPEASITDEVQDDLTTRRDDLLETPDAEALAEVKDPVLDRIDALRAQRDAKNSGDPIFDEELRKRLEGGITPPTVPE